MPTPMARTTLALSVLTAALLHDTTSAQNPSCARRVNATHAMLQECVTVDGVREHQAAFQTIADANGGTRAAGTPGYDASAQYVVERMTAAGYTVTLHGFPFTFLPPEILQQLAPVTAMYQTGCFTGSGYGWAMGRICRRRQHQEGPCRRRNADDDRRSGQLSRWTAYVD